MSKTVLDLPTEVLTQIFQFASEVPREVVTLSHVCREFNTLATENPFVWQFCSFAGILSSQTDYCAGELGNLLLKYFGKGPVCLSNPKYKETVELFEKKISERSLQLFMEEKRRGTTLVIERDMSEADKQHLVHINYSFRRPLLFSKTQYLDLLKYLHAQDAYGKRAEKIRDWFRERRYKFEEFVVKGIALHLLVLFIFILFVTTGAPRTPIDFTYPSTAIIPLYSLHAFMICALIYISISNWFESRSQSEFGQCAMLGFLSIIVLFVLSCTSRNLNNMAQYGEPRNKSIFSSWYIISFPMLCAVCITGISRGKIFKVPRLALLSLTLIYTLVLLPMYLQGWRSLSLSTILLPGFIQSIFWSINIIYALNRVESGRDKRYLLYITFLITGIGMNIYSWCIHGRSFWFCIIPFILSALLFNIEITFWR